MTALAGDLVAFLMLRIMEDEANIDMRSVPHAALVQLAPGVLVWHSFGATMPMNELHGGAGQWVIKTDPKRLHAECDAKRRLIEIATQLADDVGLSLLQALSEPYARHPDYRDQWRSGQSPH